MLEHNAFGKQLRYFRRRARDPERGGSLTQERLTHLLYDLCSLDYSFAAVSDWERGKSQIPKDHRATLTGLVLTLGKYGGLLSLAEANSWLASGNYKLLDNEEVAALRTADIQWRDLVLEQEKQAGIQAPFLAPPRPFQPIIGRDFILSDLKDKLLERETLAISAVRGLPGVGKTTVALALAHDADIQAVFPDGVMWVGLGRDPDVFFQLGLWARALGMTSREISQMTAIGMRVEAIRSILSNRAALLIIDDAWQPGHAQWFRLGGKDCSHIVTTRLPVVANDFPNAFQVSVETLNLEHSTALLSELAPQVSQSFPEAIHQLAASSAGLPLTLVLIGNYLRKIAATDQPRRIEQALNALKQDTFIQQISLEQSGAHPHPSLSHEQSISLENVIGISEQALPDDKNRLTLRKMGVFPPKPSSFSEAAALAVMGAALDELDLLVDFGLVETSGIERYQIHQSIVDYLQSRAVPAEAHINLALFYAEWLANPDLDYSDIGVEFDNIVAATTSAELSGRLDLFVTIVKEFYPFLEKRALWELTDRLLPAAIAYANQIESYHTAVHLLRSLGRAVEKRRDREQADEYWEQACIIARQQNYVDLLVILLSERSLSASSERDYDRAEEYLLEALTISKTNSYHRGMATALGYLGRLAYQSGNADQMVGYIEEAIQIAKKYEIRDLLSGLLILRGSAAYELESIEETEKYNLAALEIAREFGRKDQISNILTNLGEIETERGNEDKAIAYLEEAILIVREIGNSSREAHILKDLGILAMRRGESLRSQRYFEEGLQLAKTEENTWLMAYIRIHWGELLLEFGEIERAEELFREIIEHFPNKGKTQSIIALARFGLSQIELSRGKKETAFLLASESEKVLEEIGHQRFGEVKDFVSRLKCN